MMKNSDPANNYILDLSRDRIGLSSFVSWGEPGKYSCPEISWDIVVTERRLNASAHHSEKFILEFPNLHLKIADINDGLILQKLFRVLLSGLEGVGNIVGNLLTITPHHWPPAHRIHLRTALAQQLPKLNVRSIYSPIYSFPWTGLPESRDQTTWVFFIYSTHLERCCLEWLAKDRILHLSALDRLAIDSLPPVTQARTAWAPGQSHGKPFYSIVLMTDKPQPQVNRFISDLLEGSSFRILGYGMPYRDLCKFLMGKEQGWPIRFSSSGTYLLRLPNRKIVVFADATTGSDIQKAFKINTSDQNRPLTFSLDYAVANGHWSMKVPIAKISLGKNGHDEYALISLQHQQRCNFAIRTSRDSPAIEKAFIKPAFAG